MAVALVCVCRAVPQTPSRRRHLRAALRMSCFPINVGSAPHLGRIVKPCRVLKAADAADVLKLTVDTEIGHEPLDLFVGKHTT